MKPTQQQRVLKVLEDLRDGRLAVPVEFVRRHPQGDGISARYFKQVLLISECNGRISELRTKGYVIETSKVKDSYGFVFHRLAPQVSMEQWFDTLSPLENRCAIL